MNPIGPWFCLKSYEQSAIDMKILLCQREETKPWNIAMPPSSNGETKNRPLLERFLFRVLALKVLCDLRCNESDIRDAMDACFKSKSKMPRPLRNKRVKLSKKERFLDRLRHRKGIYLKWRIIVKFL